MDKMLGGYQALQIRLLNGRIFQKLLSKEPEAQYRSEQGKILTVLWQKEDGRATATDIATDKITGCLIMTRSLRMLPG